jgi:glycosyltransferase involved in cell wall biosynthesis
MDVFCEAYAHVDTLMRDASHSGRIKAVFLTEFQRSLFPEYWNSTIVPGMIDDDVYDLIAVPKNPKHFVYASASIKGLTPTLDTWRAIKGELIGTPHEDIELHVTGPGYDNPPAYIDEVPGVTWAGHKSPKDMQRFIAEHAGLFFVNNFIESFPAVTVLAEAVGARCHILTQYHGMGPMKEILNSPLPTDHPRVFVERFKACLDVPVGPFLESPGKDFRRSRVLDVWESTLGLTSTDEKAPQISNLPSVGLIMIAKDEAHVLPRSLSSAKGLIQYYTIIIDSENTDNSIEVIKRELSDVPGQVIQEPYVNVSYCRNRSILHAESHTDYLLALDADDEFEGTIDRGSLTLDSYAITVDDGSSTYKRPLLWKTKKGFHFEGLDHELLTSKEPNLTWGYLLSLKCRRHADGRSWLGVDTRTKFYKRAVMLEEAVAKDPSDARSAYYAGQNYMDAGYKHEAIRMFQLRAGMQDGWIEEAFMANIYMGKLLGELKLDTYNKCFFAAADLIPARLPEAMYWLAHVCFNNKLYSQAYVYAIGTAGIPKPSEYSNHFLLDGSIYDWQAMHLAALAAHYSGHEAQAKALLTIVVDHMPEPEGTRIKQLLESIQ